MTITFANSEISKFMETARIFGAPVEDMESIRKQFEEAGKKPVEYQYAWGHAYMDSEKVELQVLPSTMCKASDALTALAPTVHKFAGVAQMLKPIFIEFTEKMGSINDKIKNLFTTPCINAVYDYDRNGKRITVATCRNNVPNGTLLIKAVINDGSEPISKDEILREIAERKPVIEDTGYDKDNEMNGLAYMRALHLIRRHERGEFGAVMIDNGWKTVKDVATSLDAYSAYMQDMKTTEKQ